MGYKDKTDLLLQLKLANKDRVNKFPPQFHELQDWSETDWACAVAGEVGELCNKIKKRRRGDDIPIIEIENEIADVVIYLDLLAQRMGLDLRDCIMNKFNLTSEKIGQPKITLWKY